jgi:3-dehydro-L-gulonate-6-phosphate decarboxylase
MDNLPLLQVGLDNRNLVDALKVAMEIHEVVDIIECGTLLCFAEGMKAVSILKTLYPDKIILADIKAGDAGRAVASMAFDAGADWMTVICCAEIATIESALNEAKKRGETHDIQIELYGSWTFEQAAVWYKLGIRQVNYHRGFDAQASGQNWTKEDLEKIRKLSDMGFKVSVTGGLNVADLHFFKGIPVYVFIAGRSIRDAQNPRIIAKDFKKMISKLWG